MLTVQQQTIIALLRSALEGKKYSLAEDVDYDYINKIAKQHKIANLLFHGATNCGITSNPVFGEMFSSVCTAMAQNEQQLFEIKKLAGIFEENNIDYMPLKGLILKNMYPKSDMRPMCDADILIRFEQYEKIKQILIKLGYEEKEETDHELPWQKPSLYLELHKRIVPERDEDYYSYFGDGWKKAIKSEESPNKYVMSDEDVMIYLFTHFTKHYAGAGIGIKHMVDLWVYRSKITKLDEEYIEKELKLLHLFEFYKNVMHTLEAWFNDAQLCEKDEFITNVIFENGIFGNAKNAVLSTASKAPESSKFRRRLSVVFPSYSAMKYMYPVLKKAPFLLPVMWVVRIFKTLFFKRSIISQQLHSRDDISDDKINTYKNAMNYVGLDTEK